MTTPASNRIQEVKFEEGFTGNGKVFVQVEKQADNSESLVIYEATNVVTAFFLNLFRNRAGTFTLREWAHRKLGDLPETFDKQRLTQNIKQVASMSCIETAPEILNKLISERKLDADATSVSKSIRHLSLGKTACANEIEASLKAMKNKFQSDFGNLNIQSAQKFLNHWGFGSNRLTSMEWDVLVAVMAFKPKPDSGNLAITDSLLSYLNTGTIKSDHSKEELQIFLRLLKTIASELPSQSPFPTKGRYLATLERIEKNLKSDENASTATKPQT